MKLEFRTLHASEIECRIGTQDKTNAKWCTLLLYKDARVDQRLLDEVVGATRWQRSHELIDGQLFCTVSIYDEDLKQWVGKQDVGTESNTEKEKGRASDAFKRACFNWGIGRELYSAPSIFINIAESETKPNSRGEKTIKTTFSVKEIGYDVNRDINKLTIVDNTGKVRFMMGGKGGGYPEIVAVAEKFTTIEQLSQFYNSLPEETKRAVRDEFNDLALKFKK